MKKIKLFLAATESELQEDRMAISDLLATLNEKYEDKELYFQLVKPKQAPKAEDIEGCEMAFILWFRHSDEITSASFEQALRAFQQKGSPKIVTYFKQSDQSDIADDVSGFMERLDKELGHYYNIYSHIDSLRFSILMQVSLLEQSLQVECDKGLVKLDGQEMLSLYSLPCAGENVALASLQSRFKKATADFYELRELREDNGDDEDILDRFVKVSEERKELREQIGQMEKNIFSAALSMAQNISKGGLSQRQREAYRLFEKGDYAGANEILNFDEIKEDIKGAEAVAQIVSGKLETSVNELLQKISVIEAGIITDGGYDEIRQCFNEAVRVEQTHNLPKIACEKYFEWLITHHENDAAIDLGERLMLYRKLENRQAITLLQPLSQLYFLIQQYEKAESLAQLLLSESDKEQEEFATQRLNAYVVLSKAFAIKADYNGAEQMNNKGFATYRAIGDKLPQERLIALRSPLTEQTIEVSMQQDKYELAVAFCQSQVDGISRVMGENEDELTPLYLEWVLKLARLYERMGKTPDAERLLFSIREQADRVLNSDPTRYAPILAQLYLQLAGLAFDNCFIKAALEYGKKARDIFSPIYKLSPSAHWEFMTKCHFVYGKAQVKMDYGADAADTFNMAIEISNENAKNIELLSNKAILSKLYSDLGEAYFYTKDDMYERLEYLNKAGESGAQVADSWPSIENILAFCNTLIKSSDCMESAEVYYEAAKEQLDSAIGIFEKNLGENLQMVYIDYANGYECRADLLLKMGDYQGALADYEKVIDIINQNGMYKIVYFPREMYILSRAYEGVGFIKNMEGYAEKALAAYKLSYNAIDGMDSLFTSWHTGLKDGWSFPEGWLYTMDSCPNMNYRHSSAALNYGILLEHSGQKEEAENYFVKAFEIADSNPFLQKERGSAQHSPIYLSHKLDILQSIINFAQGYEESVFHDLDRLGSLPQGIIADIEELLESNQDIDFSRQMAVAHEMMADILQQKAWRNQDFSLLLDALMEYLEGCSLWERGLDREERQHHVLDLLVDRLENCKKTLYLSKDIMTVIEKSSDKAEAQEDLESIGDVFQDTLKKLDIIFQSYREIAYDNHCEVLFAQDARVKGYNLALSMAGGAALAAWGYDILGDGENGRRLCQEFIELCAYLENIQGSVEELGDIKAGVSQLLTQYAQLIERYSEV